MRKENLFKNTETANAVANAILANNEFCNMYSLSESNMNTSLENNNRVVTVNETLELSRQIIDTMKLQSDFFSAVSRITTWIDSNAIVVFVGAVFTVHSTLANIDSKSKNRLNELFNESLDKKYNERRLKGKIITNLTETRHSFDSIEKASEFLTLLMSAIVVRKQALTETAKETEKKAEEKQNAKKLSAVKAETLAEMTKEVIEAEIKKA